MTTRTTRARPSKGQLLDMYRKMALIRNFEEQVRQLYMQGLIRGSTHLYIGEEAVAVGVCAALNADDYITSTHRGHGHCLAKGGDPKRMMAELLGRATGYCKGKGGSMHIADLDLGILGANGIVGGGLGIAAGAAYACRYRGDRRVAVCFFGDGALNQGAFLETANMAALWKLPLIYVCEHNQFAEFSYSRDTFADPDLAKRSAPFGFPGVEVDGNDVLAVYRTTRRAVARARAGDGPTLIIAHTYRLEGHTIGDPLTYRDKAEVEEWRQRDPIPRFRDHLLTKGIASAEQLEAIWEEARRACEEAVRFALDSPNPAPSALQEDVYA